MQYIFIEAQNRTANNRSVIADMGIFVVDHWILHWTDSANYNSIVVYLIHSLEAMTIKSVEYLLKVKNKLSFNQIVCAICEIES